MKTGNSCQKRACLTVFGGMVILCLCGFHSCNMEVEVRESETAMRMTKRLENGFYRYFFMRKVIVSARPVECLLLSRYGVDKSYAGRILLDGVVKESVSNLLNGRKELMIPAGTEIELGDFFVDKPGGLGDFGRGDDEYYFLTFKIPGRPEWDCMFVYFMGYNGKIIAPFWEEAEEDPDWRTFTPPDIERIFPGGLWIYD